MYDKHMLPGASAFDVIKIIISSNPVVKSVNFKFYFPAKHFSEESDKNKKSVDRMLKESPRELELKMKIKREDILSDDFTRIIESNTLEGRSVAVISKVRNKANRKVFHIPMMDFDCEINLENQRMIEDFLKKAGYQGFVLVSGASYHFYGINLISEKEWMKFLGRMILFTGYTDTRYIGHRLSSGFCALRISEQEKTGSKIPSVVAVID